MKFLLVVPLDAQFPELRPAAPHSKCMTQVAPGYPARDLDNPPTYTAPRVLEGPDWADPTDPRIALQDRPEGRFQSYEGEHPSASDGVTPLNPRGYTGIKGRGLLGRWGANFAADPIVTRVNPSTGKLEMIAICRKDSGQWAIPGGMVDFGEALSGTLSRELAEEALGKESGQVAALEARFRALFETRGTLVYAGYVDDPRNTDNAWMETRAVHLHLGEGEADFELHAGDDAGHVQWMEINQDNLRRLYASHGTLVSKAVRDWQIDAGRLVLLDGKVMIPDPPSRKSLSLP